MSVGERLGTAGKHVRSAPRACLRQIRRIPRAGRACFLLAFVNVAIWGVIVPPFMVPDETTHFAYAQYFAETGQPPRQLACPPDLSYPCAFSQQEAVALAALQFGATYGSHLNRGIYTAVEQRALRTALAENDQPLGLGGASVASNQPPLYYALEAIPYWLSPSNDILTRLVFMRLLSALMAAGTVLAIFLFLRELLPRTPWAWTVGALMVAFQPMFAFIGAGVQADNLLYLASALTFFTIARAWQRGLTVRRSTAIGGALAIGMLAKLTFLALLPGAGLALLLLGWRARPAGTRPALQRLGAGVGVAAAPVALYLLLNATVWSRGSALAGGLGNVAHSVASAGSTNNVSWRAIVDYAWQLYLPRVPYMNHVYFPSGYPLWSIWFNGSIGHFGWLDYTFPSWVYNDFRIVVYVLAAPRPGRRVAGAGRDSPAARAVRLLRCDGDRASRRDRVPERPGRAQSAVPAVPAGALPVPAARAVRAGDRARDEGAAEALGAPARSPAGRTRDGPQPVRADADDLALLRVSAAARSQLRARTHPAADQWVLGLAAVTAAGAALRFSTLAVQSFWLDEAVTHQLVTRSLRGMLSAIPHSESTPPLYYLAAWLWVRIFGAGAAGLRSLSALFGTVTIVLVALIARRLAGSGAAVAAAALAAANPLLIWYSQEARAYALLVLLCTVSLWCLLRGDWLGFAAASALALATHYFAIFFVGPEGASLAWRHGRRSRAAGVACGAVAVVGLALLPLAIVQASGSRAAFITSTALGHRIIQVPKQFLIGYATAQVTLLTVLAAALIVALALRLRRSDATMLALAAVSAGVPIVLALAGADYLITRNVIAAMVPLVVLGGVASTRGRGGPLIVAGLCAAGIVAFAGVEANASYQRDDWRGVADAMGAPVRGPRAVVLSPASGALPLALYARLHVQPVGRPVVTREIDVIRLARDLPHPTTAPAPAGFTYCQAVPTPEFLLMRFCASAAEVVPYASLQGLELAPDAQVLQGR